MPAKRAPAKKSAGERSERAAPKRLDWEEKVLGRELSGFTEFSISRTFSLGELVTHRKFGPGFVAEVLGPEKVSIMFQDGSRVLAMGKP